MRMRLRLRLSHLGWLTWIVNWRKKLCCLSHVCMRLRLSHLGWLTWFVNKNRLCCCMYGTIFSISIRERCCTFQAGESVMSWLMTIMHIQQLRREENNYTSTTKYAMPPVMTVTDAIRLIYLRANFTSKSVVKNSNKNWFQAAASNKITYTGVGMYMSYEALSDFSNANQQSIFLSAISLPLMLSAAFSQAYKIIW